MPDWKRHLRVRLALLRLTPEREAEIAEELSQHLDDRYEELRAAGTSDADARRVALDELCDAGALADEMQSLRQAHAPAPIAPGASRVGPFRDLWQDLRHAARLLHRQPGFAAAAIATLALGIGANTFVFSVVNALVLRPLPVGDPEAVVFVEHAHRDSISHSYPNYRDLRDRNRTFAGLAGYRIAPMNVESGDRTMRAWGYLATGNYFDVLAITPAAGRLFTQNDDRQPGAHPVVVLSHDYWAAHFRGDPAVVGTTIRINRLPYTILGVTSRGFRGTERFYQPAVWVPMMMQPQIEAGNPWLDRRMTSNVWIIGRLAPSVRIAQAEADLNAVAVQLAREHPDSNSRLAFRLTRPGLAGDALGTPVRIFTLSVLALAALLLMATCANLASLLLARVTDRQREIAIRISLGAGRARLLRQFAVEAMALSAAGGAAGAIVAAVASRALSAWRPPLDFPIQFDVAPDWRVFLFACAISAAAGVLCGVVPAYQASLTDPNATIKGTDAAPQRLRRLAFRDVLVAVQISMSVVLVAACLLSVRGLYHLVTTPVGFDPRGVAVISFELALTGYRQAGGRSFQERALGAVNALPGLQAAAYANSLPLSIDQSSTMVIPEDQAGMLPADAPRATYYEISPGFFRAMGIPLLAGRDITPADDTGAPLVAVINEAFARRILRTPDAVGRRFRYGSSGPFVEVVGVVADGKYRSLTEAPQPVLFRPMRQSYNSTTIVVARSALPPGQMVGMMRQAIAALDPDLTLYGTGTLEEMLALPLFPGRAAATTLSAFGLLAIVLLATGIHGLAAYAVARREREIGIRVAVGASGKQVLRLVLGRMAVLLAVGGASGVLLALVAGRAIAGLLYQVSPHDPLVLGGVLATTVAVTALACWRPVHRALRIDPAVALRAE